MDPVRLAIIGAGQIGTWHAELMQNQAEGQLVAIADPSPATERVAERFGVQRYVDFETMLAKVKPDGVVVATPNQLHATAAKACARHGVHILLEKPVADGVTEGRKLLDIVNQAGVRMIVGHHRRFDPAARSAHEILNTGKIGNLQAVTATWAVRKHDLYFDAEWRRVEGGGPVLLNLIHDIDMLRHLCGEIATVYAELSSQARGHEVEDTAAIIARFQSGALATIIVSDATPSPWGWEFATGENPQMPASGENCYQFMGTKGSFGFPHIQLWHHEDTDNGSWHEAISVHTEEKATRQAMANQLKHFCAVIRGVEAPYVSGEDGLATLAATEAVKRSAKSGAPMVPEFTL
jgi:predicted dehydrogenase